MVITRLNKQESNNANPTKLSRRGAREIASMQTAKSHAVEGSVVNFALPEAIAKLKASRLQLPGIV
jgi:hypothetical protein